MKGAVSGLSVIGYLRLSSSSEHIFIPKLRISFGDSAENKQLPVVRLQLTVNLTP